MNPLIATSAKRLAECCGQPLGSSRFEDGDGAAVFQQGGQFVRGQRIKQGHVNDTAGKSPPPEFFGQLGHEIRVGIDKRFVG